MWFPAHWAPVVLHQLQHKEDEYRTAHPSWMDQEVAPDDIQTQWQEARANRRMQFKVGDYKWYAGVYALPTVWPDVSMLGASNLRRVVGYDFHHIRKKYDVPSMWGNIRPQWRLLQQHLETKGPGWYTRLQKEKSGSVPTGLIGLEMI